MAQSRNHKVTAPVTSQRSTSATSIALNSAELDCVLFCVFFFGFYCSTGILIRLFKYFFLSCKTNIYVFMAIKEIEQPSCGLPQFKVARVVAAITQFVWQTSSVAPADPAMSHTTTCLVYRKVSTTIKCRLGISVSYFIITFLFFFLFF